MSILSDIKGLLTDEPAFVGYAPTGQKVPYSVVRPIIIADEGRNLDGSAAAWDQQYGVYCVGGSVEASYNLAIMCIKRLDGKRVGSTTLSTSMGYVGAVVEGAYESQVTVQLNQGDI